jgi:cytochrome P450
MGGSATADHPSLAGAGPPPRRTPLGLRRLDRSHNPAPGIVAAAYEQAVTRQLTPVGAFYVAATPEAVKRVFLDNVANYPKSPLDRRLFATVFGDGLASREGEPWRTHRRIMAPAFAPPCAASYAPGMAIDVSAFQEAWDRAATAGDSIDAARDMSRLTLQIILHAMFSTDSAALGAIMEQSLDEAMAATRAGLGDFMPGLDRIRQRRREARVAAIFADLDLAVGRMVADREAAPGGADLLARLIAARDSETGAGMTAREVRDEVVTIFVAGHETTAAAMAWVWYLLSQHPQVEAKLHAELDAVLGGRAPGAEDLPKLVYARMVIEETLRFYPPSPGTSFRVALAEDVVCGVKIPKGAMVIVMPWVTHRHRAVWEEPNRFDPERFAPSKAAGRSRYAYIPFGAGPRVCIGASLAMTEMLIILASLAQRYRLTLSPGQEVEIHREITMRPKGGLPMMVTRR